MIETLKWRDSLEYPRLLRLYAIIEKYEIILDSPKSVEMIAQPYQNFFIGRRTEKNVPTPGEARDEIIEKFKRSIKHKPEYYIELGTIFAWIESMPEKIDDYLHVVEGNLDDEVLDGLERQLIKLKSRLNIHSAPFLDKMTYFSALSRRYGFM